MSASRLPASVRRRRFFARVRRVRGRLSPAGRRVAVSLRDPAVFRRLSASLRPGSSSVASSLAPVPPWRAGSAFALRWLARWRRAASAPRVGSGPLGPARPSSALARSAPFFRLCAPALAVLVFLAPFVSAAPFAGGWLGWVCLVAAGGLFVAAARS